MQKKISRLARGEIIQAVVERYRVGDRAEKGRILDEFVKLTGYHRKHAVRLLNAQPEGLPATCHSSRRIYGEAIREALVAIWEAADRICGKRLKAVMPDFVESLEQHGHLSLNDTARTRLLTVSAATIDRILSPMRRKAKGRPRSRRNTTSHIKNRIPVRTFSDWSEPAPGYFETDFVAHNGSVSSGSCVHTLVLTDVASGWTECTAMVVHEQSLLIEALKAVDAQLPIPLLGIDTDNDSVFVNETVVGFCTEHQIEFTRSRAYLKNDQAWIEQKNGSIVRRFVGYHRLSGILAAQVLGRLYGLTRLYVNFFQPSFKLRNKTRTSSHVHRSYFSPATPCERLLNSALVSEEAKDALREQKATLDPVRLIHTIRELQSTIAALATQTDPSTGRTPSPKSLDQFLEQLPRLWKQGEVRATHRKNASAPRSWRTRKDPFESVWPEVLSWLQSNPDISATDLFARLKAKYPDVYADGQLRTLQRRVQGWRRVMARELLGISHSE